MAAQVLNWALPLCLQLRPEWQKESGVYSRDCRPIAKIIFAAGSHWKKKRLTFISSWIMIFSHLLTLASRQSATCVWIIEGVLPLKSHGLKFKTSSKHRFPYSSGQSSCSFLGSIPHLHTWTVADKHHLWELYLLNLFIVLFSHAFHQDALASSTTWAAI